MSAFRDNLASVVPLPDQIPGSIADFGHRLARRIEEEVEHIRPDNALVAVLCDAARVIDELLEAKPWTLRSEAVTCPKCLALEAVK